METTEFLKYAINLIDKANKYDELLKEVSDLREENKSLKSELNRFKMQIAVMPIAQDSATSLPTEHQQLDKE